MSTPKEPKQLVENTREPIAKREQGWFTKVSVLDQWEEEAKEQWKNIEHARCAERILALIDLVRKKYEILKRIADSIGRQVRKFKEKK